MRSNYGQKSLLAAVQSVKDHICFTKLFLLKMGCEISGWTFFSAVFFSVIDAQILLSRDYNETLFQRSF